MIHAGLRCAFCPIPSSSERTAFRIQVPFYSSNLYVTLSFSDTAKSTLSPELAGGSGGGITSSGPQAVSVTRVFKKSKFLATGAALHDFTVVYSTCSTRLKQRITTALCLQRHISFDTEGEASMLWCAASYLPMFPSFVVCDILVIIFM